MSLHDTSPHVLRTCIAPKRCRPVDLNPQINELRSKTNGYLIHQGACSLIGILHWLRPKCPYKKSQIVRPRLPFGLLRTSLPAIKWFCHFHFKSHFWMLKKMLFFWSCLTKSWQNAKFYSIHFWFRNYKKNFFENLAFFHFEDLAFLKLLMAKLVLLIFLAGSPA